MAASSSSANKGAGVEGAENEHLLGGEEQPDSQPPADGDEAVGDDAAPGQGQHAQPGKPEEKELALGEFVKKAGMGKSKTAAHIADLKREREQMRSHVKKANSTIKNARRREKRLREKASKLDNNDLMEVFRMRSETEAKKAQDKKPAAPE